MAPSSYDTPQLPSHLINVAVQISQLLGCCWDEPIRLSPSRSRAGSRESGRFARLRPKVGRLISTVGKHGRKERKFQSSSGQEALIIGSSSNSSGNPFQKYQVQNCTCRSGSCCKCPFPCVRFPLPLQYGHVVLPYESSPALHKPDGEIHEQRMQHVGVL